MTALVLSGQASLFDRLESPFAGSEAKQLKKSVLCEFKRLKLEGARTSWVFNDLQNLAREHEDDQAEVFKTAQRFLLALPANVAEPELDLDKDGEVVFDWKGSFGRLLTVTLRDDGRVSYAARLSFAKSTYGEDQFSDSIPSDILGLVHKVTQT